jgi:hypothetical protein
MRRAPHDLAQNIAMRYLGLETFRILSGCAGLFRRGSRLPLSFLRHDSLFTADAPLKSFLPDAATPVVSSDESLQRYNGNDSSASHSPARKLTAQYERCDGTGGQPQSPGGFGHPHCEYSFIVLHDGASPFLPLQNLLPSETIVLLLLANDSAC